MFMIYFTHREEFTHNIVDIIIIIDKTIPLIIRPKYLILSHF